MSSLAAFGELAGNLLAELDTKLVEGIDPHQHRIGEGAVLVESDQGAERVCVQPLRQHRRARPVAGIAALRIIARAPLHQRGTLSEGIEQQQAMMFLVLVIVAFADGDEFDRHQQGALVKELEYGVLGIGPGPTPGHRGGRAVDWRAIDLHRLAVRFHLQLLEVERQQPKPLVIGEHGARLRTRLLGVKAIGEGGEQRHIGRRFGEAEMAVHLGRAFEQAFERVPAERERCSDADGAPQRISPADASAELQDPRLVDSRLDCSFGLGGDRDESPVWV